MAWLPRGPFPWEMERFTVEELNALVEEANERDKAAAEAAKRRG